MKIVYPTDANGNIISFATKEKDVYDANGVSLTEKLAGIVTSINESNQLQNTTKVYDNSVKIVENYNQMYGKYNALSNEITNLKKYVSDGKTSIAAAITEKGIQAAGSEDFNSLSSKIQRITVNNIKIDNKYDSSVNVYVNTRKYDAHDVGRSGKNFTALPASDVFDQAASVYCDGKLYILGLSDGSETMERTAVRTRCYSYDYSTSSWKSIASIPVRGGIVDASNTLGTYLRAVVLNNEIYLAQTTNDFYKYSPSTNTWTKLTKLPLRLNQLSTVTIYNNKIIFVSAEYNVESFAVGIMRIKFYEYNGESASTKWTLFTTKTLDLKTASIYNGSEINANDSSPLDAIGMNDGIHIMYSYFHLLIPSGYGAEPALNLLGALDFSTSYVYRNNLFVYNNVLYAIIHIDDSSYLFHYDTSTKEFICDCNLGINLNKGDVTIHADGNKLYAFGGSFSKGHGRNCKVYDMDFSQHVFYNVRTVSK